MSLSLTPEQKAAIDEQKQYCPFCKIVKGEIPAQKVYEDKDCIVILDINPGVPGHCLLVPKEHYPVLPFVPDATRDAIATLYPRLAHALAETMIVRGTELLIANGAAAGQQTSHFLVHLFPTDKPLFTLPAKEHPGAAAMRAALGNRYGDPRERLSAVLGANPALRQMVVERPEAFGRELPSAPDLAPLFAGVDIQALGLTLAETEPPRAAQTEDAQLLRYLAGKERLRALLLEDPATLEEALASQPKLARFFEGTTVAAVRDRVTRLGGGAA
jgi:histidine triad (HIT) family protein